MNNSFVRTWGSGTLTSIKSRYVSLINSKNRSDDGIDSIKISYSTEDGDISRIRFRFVRHLIFVHKGAGKGIGGNKGSSWATKSGKTKRTDPKSLGKIGTSSRKAKEWLNPVLDAEIPKLADQLMKEKIDAAINALKI
ncbi:hypothetical protein [Sphingobacterium spiritivorum]|uniref:hypothetical protein n=1 Tax=Sphingobacterium spiritivorum TaxID=258 RepID=UPI003DA66139